MAKCQNYIIGSFFIFHISFFYIFAGAMGPAAGMTSFVPLLFLVYYKKPKSVVIGIGILTFVNYVIRLHFAYLTGQPFSLANFSVGHFMFYVMTAILMALKILIQKYHQTQEALVSTNQQLQEMKDIAEEANHHKSQFLAQISHDLRTPMHVVSGILDHINT